MAPIRGVVYQVRLERKVVEEPHFQFIQYDLIERGCPPSVRVFLQIRLFWVRTFDGDPPLGRKYGIIRQHVKCWEAIGYLLIHVLKAGIVSRFNVRYGFGKEVRIVSTWELKLVCRRSCAVEKHSSGCIHASKIRE